jgi:hypothetical protein
MAFLCVSQQGEFKTTIKLFEKSQFQKLFSTKSEGGGLFCCHFFPKIFFPKKIELKESRFFL